jgi:hypothetical protein
MGDCMCVFVSGFSFCCLAVCTNLLAVCEKQKAKAYFLARRSCMRFTMFCQVKSQLMVAR